MPAVAALAQIAARSAFPDHAGLFGSPLLEQILHSVGLDLHTPRPARRGIQTDSHRRDILHVLTYARPVGGDGRFVWRWMLADPASRHSVAITTQGHYKGVFEVPAFLREGAQASGGSVHEIHASPSTPIEQAIELRGLCRDRDLIVLHLWPYDTVPVIALAAGCDDVPTVLVNHSDHTFWIGGSVAHSVVHLREQSPKFLLERRSIDPLRAYTLPIPLVYQPYSVDRDQAKRALGYDPDKVVLLTVASPFKFSALGHVNFLDLVVPVLEKSLNATLIAIGPKCNEEWQTASRKTGGRIKTLGARWDTNQFYAAADVYLDSVPFSSITSMLEAGCHGLPVLGLVPETECLSLLGPGAPGLEGAMELATDSDDYRTRLTRFISDSGLREEGGQRLQKRILACHTGDGWQENLRKIYNDLESFGPRGCLVSDQDAFDTTGLDLALFQLYAHAHEPDHERRLIRNYIGALPYFSRLSVSRRLSKEGFGVSRLNSLPPPLSGLVRGIGRPAKRILNHIRSSLDVRTD